MTGQRVQPNVNRSTVSSIVQTFHRENRFILIYLFVLQNVKGGSCGLMVESRTHNRKVASSSLRQLGIVGGGSECTVLSPSSIPRRGALEQGTEPTTAPWAPRHKWLPTAPGVCSWCVCVHCCVCALGWVNVEHEFRIYIYFIIFINNNIVKVNASLFVHSVTAEQPRAGGRAAVFNHQQEQEICNMVIANNSIRLREIQSAIINDNNVFANIHSVSISTIDIKFWKDIKWQWNYSTRCHLRGIVKEWRSCGSMSR